MPNLKKLIHSQPCVLNLARFFGVWTPQPLFLLTHLTLACNRRCTDCYQRDDFYSAFRGADLTPDAFERVLGEASLCLIKPRIHFFGGEPLMNPHFAQLLAATDRRAFKSSLTTNGVLLGKYAEDISNSGLDQVNISIDDIGERYGGEEGLTGVFEAITAAIRMLKHPRKGQNKKTINVNCVISERNQHRLADIAQHFIDNDINIDVLTFQHPYFLPPGPDIDLDILASGLARIAALKANFEILSVPHVKRKDLSAFYTQPVENARKGGCIIPWLGLNILPDLKVTPGGGVLGCNLVTGDLKKNSLKELWNNTRMTEFRKRILRHELPEACSRCCHRQHR